MKLAYCGEKYTSAGVKTKNLKCWSKCSHTPGACKDHIAKKKKKRCAENKMSHFYMKTDLMLRSSFKPEEWQHVIRVKNNCNSWYENAPCLRDKPSTWVWNQTDIFFLVFFSKYIKLTCKTWGRKKFQLQKQRWSLPYNDYNFTVHAFMCKSIQIQI